MKTTTWALSALLTMLSLGIAGAGELPSAAPQAGTQAVKKQTRCPVEGGVIKTNLFADVDGKRVYFCCKGCPEKFAANPAPYLEKLQKAGVTLDPAPAPATPEGAAGAPEHAH